MPKLKKGGKTIQVISMLVSLLFLYVFCRMNQKKKKFQRYILIYSPLFSATVFCCSGIQSCLTLCNPVDYSTLGFPVLTISLSFLKLVSIESMIPSNHLILCHPLLLLPSSFPASGSFPMSQLFASGGQSIGASASASILPMSIQG